VVVKGVEDADRTRQVGFDVGVDSTAPGSNNGRPSNKTAEA
jgi:hypothetical protein